MPAHNTNEERQILAWLEKLPDTFKTKAKWIKRLDEDGMTDELAEEIRKKLLKEESADKTRHLVEFTRLTKTWRMAEQAKHFKKH